MTTGHRFHRIRSPRKGLVDDCAAVDDLLATAIAKASSLTGKDANTLGAIKATMFATALERLAPTAVIPDQTG